MWRAACHKKKTTSIVNIEKRFRKLFDNDRRIRFATGDDQSLALLFITSTKKKMMIYVNDISSLYRVTSRRNHKGKSHSNRRSRHSSLFLFPFVTNSARWTCAKSMSLTRPLIETQRATGSFSHAHSRFFLALASFLVQRAAVLAIKKKLLSSVSLLSRAVCVL